MSNMKRLLATAPLLLALTGCGAWGGLLNFAAKLAPPVRLTVEILDWPDLVAGEPGALQIEVEGEFDESQAGLERATVICPPRTPECARGPGAKVTLKGLEEVRESDRAPRDLLAPLPRYPVYRAKGAT